MVGVVAGSGLGLFNAAQTTQGDHGSVARGVHVNARSGNLVVQAQDRVLSGSGQDLFAQRTYNLFGATVTGAWRGDDARSLVLTGTRNSAGSVVLRTNVDGHESAFAWNGSRYLSTDGDGAHDLIEWDAASGQWVYTEGSSRLQERYDGTTGRLVALRDPSGNDITLTRNVEGKLVSQRDTGSGQELVYVYGTNGQLARLDTRTVTGGELTRQVHYTYDNLGRLTRVSTDLSPADGSITDGVASVTEYTWGADSARLTGIGVDNVWTYIEYTQVGSQHRVFRVTDSAGTTRFDYNDAERTTTLTNHAGRQWLYRHDANGRLTELTLKALPGESGSDTWTYAYDNVGNLTGTVDSSGRGRQWRYDAAGNLLREWDDAGQLIERTWSAGNRLLTETRFENAAALVAGEAVASATGAVMVTRHVYDAALRLRFEISDEGAVTEHRYDARGLCVQTSRYTASRFDVAALAASAVPTENAMAVWANGTAVRAAQKQTRYSHDVRGNLSAVVEFAKVNAAGVGIDDAAMRRTEFVYSEQGQLLQSYQLHGESRELRSQISACAYDNAGRLISETDAAGTRTHGYDAANRRYTVAHSAGLTQVSASDAYGRVVSRTEVVNGEADRVTRFVYEGDRLRMTETADGNRRYAFFDKAGRQTAQVNAMGEVIEFVFDSAGRQTGEIRYATRVGTANWFNGTRVIHADVSAIRPPASNDDRRIAFGYDNAGRRTQVTDAAGTLTTSAYDAAGRMTAQHTGDRFTRWLYSDEGLLLAQLDAEGYLVRHEYDAAGQRTRSTRHANAVAENLREVGSLAQLQASAGSNGRLAYFFYDGAGRKIGEVNEQQFVTAWVFRETARTRQQVQYLTPYTAANLGSITWDALLASATLTNSEKLVTTETLDTAGRVVLRTDSAGLRTTFEYDADGRLIKEVHAEGTSDARIDRYRFDARGQLLGRLWGESAFNAGSLPADAPASHFAIYGEAYSYDLAGNRAQVTARGERVSTFYYDAAGRLTHAMDPTGSVREHTFNAFGETTQIRAYANALDVSARNGMVGGTLTVPQQATLTNLRDAIRDSIRSTSFTTRGLVNTVTDAEGFRTRNTYTDFGELASVAREFRPGEFITDAYTWSKRGEQLSFTRDVGGLNSRTAQVFNAFGEITQLTDARGKTGSILRSASGRIVTETDVLGRVTSRQFDALGRVLTETDALNNVTTHRWEDAGRKHTVTTPEGLVTVTEQNAHGQVIAISNSDGTRMHYAYNRNGSLLTVTDDAGTVITSNTWFETEHLRTRTEIGSGTVEYTWDAAGRELTRTHQETGLVTTTTWDPRGWQRTVTENGAVPRLVTTWTHDRNGLVLTKTRDPDGLALRNTWTYDGAGRVLTVSEGTASEPAQSSTRYEYDALGRVVREIRDPAGLQLTTQNRYDAGGRLTRVIHPDGSNTWHVYDDGGLLRFTVNALGEVTGHGYDSNGRRVTTIRYANRISTSGFGDAISTPAVVADATRDVRTWTVYDGDGREKYSVDAMGRVTEFQYDARGKLVSRTFRAREMPPQVVAWQANFSSGFDDFANPALAAAWTDIYSRDAAGNALIITQPNGASGGSFLYTRQQDFAAGIGYSLQLTTGETLPAKALFGISNRLSGSGNPPPGRRLTLGISGGYLCADVITQTGWKSVQLGLAERNTAYRVEFETRAASAVMYVYKQGESRAQGYSYEIETSGWSELSFCVWGFRAPDGDGSRICISQLTELARAADPEAVVTQYRHDALGRLRFTVDASGTVTEQRYNAAGQRAETLAYEERLALPVPVDVAGLEERLVDASYRSTKYGFDAAGRVIWQFETYNGAQAGGVRSWEYNARDQIIAEYVASLTGGSRTTRHVYDTVGRRRLTIDARGYVQETAYDAMSRVTRRTHYLNSWWGTLHANTDAATVAASIQQANSAAGSRRETRFVHDAVGRLRFEIDALGGVKETAYDALGNAWLERTWLTNTQTNLGDGSEVSIAAALNGMAHRRTLHAYDPAGRLRYTLDAANFLSETAYDAMGNIVARTRYGAPLTNTALTQSTAPLAAKSFDSAAAIQSTPQGMRRTRYAYERDGGLRYSIDAAGYITEQMRDAFGRVIRETSHGLASSLAGLPNSEQVASEVQRMTALTGYTQRSTFIRHDVQGNAVITVDALGYVTTREFDAFGAMVSEARHGLALAAVVGDSESRAHLEQRADFIASMAGTARKTIHVRDALGRVIERRDPSASHVINGQMVTGQRVTRYVYDGYGQLAELREGEVLTGTTSNTNAVRATRYGYDALGRQTLVVLPGWHDASYGRTYADPGSYWSQRTQVHQIAEYDAFGDKVFENRVLKTDSNQIVEQAKTWRIFDALGRQRYEIDALGGVHETRYEDALSTQTVIRYANAVDTRYLPNRLTEASVGPTQTVRLQADTTRDRSIETTFDVLGRKTSVRQSAVATWRYSGDSANTTGVAVVHGLGENAVVGYASVNGATTQAVPEIRYQYNAWGDTVQEDVQGSGKTWRYYDALGREVAVVDQAGYLTQREYLAESTQVSRDIQYANAIATGNLSVAVRPSPAQAVLQDKDRVIVYTHDALQRITGITRENVSRRYQPFTNGVAGTAVIESGRTVALETRAYNGWGDVDSVTDAGGNVTRQEYDALGRVSKLIEPARSTFRVDGLLTSALVKASPTITFTYNVFGDIASQTRAAGAQQLGLVQSSSNEFDLAGNVIARVDALGNRTVIKVDDHGRTVSEEQTVTANWQGIGGWQNATQTLKREFRRDLLGRQTATIDHYKTPEGQAATTTHSVAYNTFGEIEQRFINGHLLESHAYDRAGRHVVAVTANGRLQMDYDVAGRLTRKTQVDPEYRLADRVSVFRHDALGRVTEERLPAAFSNTDVDATGDEFWVETASSYGGAYVIPLAKQQYDRWGNVVSRTDARGANTLQSRDHLDRLIEETLPQTVAMLENGSVVNGRVIRQYVYDDDGTQTSRIEFFRRNNGTLQGGRVRSMEYNEVGQLVAETDATGNRREYRLDAHGNRFLTRDGEGQWSYDVHDAANRAITHGNVIWNNWVAAKRNVYDEAGRLYMEVFGSVATDETVALVADPAAAQGGISVVGNLGNTRLTKFDERGNVVMTRNESGVVEQFTFNAENRKHSAIVGSSAAQTWTYDNARFGRLASHKDMSGRVITPGYNGFGEKISDVWSPIAGSQLSVIGDVIGSHRNYSYDGAGRLWKTSHLETRLGSWTVEVATLRGYDAVGNLLAENSRQTRVDINYHFGYQRVYYQLDALARIVRTEAPLAWCANHDSINVAYFASELNFLTVEYDEFGNRRRVASSRDGYADLDNWYTYDAENRVLVSEGARNANGQIVIRQGADGLTPKGAVVTYDRNGRRATEERWARDAYVMAINGGTVSLLLDQYKVSSFAYTFDDHVASVTDRNVFRANGSDGAAARVVYSTIKYQAENGIYYEDAADATVIRELNTFDARGNRTSQRRYGPRQYLTDHHFYFYRGDGQLLLQQDFRRWMVLDAQTVMGESHPANAMRDAWGNQRHYRYEKYKDDGKTLDFTQTYQIDYAYFDSASQRRIRATRAGYADGVTEFYFTSQGHLVRTTSSGLTRSFTNNTDGKIISRVEGGVTQRHIHRDGAALVEFGTAAPTALAAAFISASEGEARGGNTRYTVTGTSETAESVALQVYGDTRYWYIVADANGLASGTAVIERGTTLALPNVLANNFNSASTVAPYRQSDATGNTTPMPQPPPPPKPKSAALKMAIMVVVAVVATILTAGAAAPGVAATFAGGTSVMGTLATASMASAQFWAAAGALAVGSMVGSVASQVVGKRLGMVEDFSWREVGKAGLTSLLSSTGIGVLNSATAGLNLKNAHDWVGTARNAAASYAGNYAGSRLFGENPSFSWQALAGNAITSAGLGYAMGEWGGKIGLDGNSGLQQLGRNGVIAGASAHLEDKWFGGPRASRSALANGVVTQFAAQWAGGALDALRSGNSVRVGADGGMRDARVAQASAEPEAGPRLALGPSYSLSNRSRSLMDFELDWSAADGYAEASAQAAAASPFIPMDAVVDTSDAFDASQSGVTIRDAKFFNGNLVTGRFHTVSDGDTVSALAGSSAPGQVGAFAAFNNLRSSNLRIGQRVFVPDDFAAAGNQTAFGQALIDRDNRRLAAIAAEKQRLANAQRAAPSAPTLSGSVAGGDSFVDSLLGGGEFSLVDSAMSFAANSSTAGKVGVAPKDVSGMAKAKRMLASGLSALEVSALVSVKLSLQDGLQAFGNEQAVKGNTFAMHLGGVTYGLIEAVFPTSAVDLVPMGRAASAGGKLMRMADDVPERAAGGVDVGAGRLEDAGRVSSTATTAASSPGRLDYSATFSSDLRNFNPGYAHFSGALDGDLLLVQFHRSDRALGQGRSASWWTTPEQANEYMTVDSVRDGLALPPGWGPRDAVSVALIPKGTEVEFFHGTALKQSENGTLFGGNGIQYRFKDFDSSWILDTRKIPGATP